MGATEKGVICQLVIQKEPSYKVDPVTPDAQVIYLRSDTIAFSRPNESSDVSRGANRNPTKPARGLDDVGGDISTELQAYIGRLYEGVMGTVVTTGTGPYVHTFKHGPLSSWMLERKYPTLGKYAKYNGCKFGKLSMDVTTKGFQNITVSTSGAKETISDAPFDATPLDLGKVSFDGRSIMLIEEGGVAIATISKISGLTIDNGLDLGEENYALGGDGSRDDIPEGMVKVTGTAHAMFKTIDLYNKAKNGTESSIRVKYALGDGNGTAGNESLELKLSELVYSPKTPPIAGPKGLVVEAPFEAYYENSAEASALQLILKNTQASI
ncbi:MAG: hypothetical protein A2075_12210 [Geobacteraceae bacterium GWC2_58_44]|nr:MAG: hypothetical protein A2075_12210 [Geobacteraceae bacterium GWC2_58_44]HBG06326.1 hypothetical protein [Geobacter sp.]